MQISPPRNAHAFSNKRMLNSTPYPNYASSRPRQASSSSSLRIPMAATHRNARERAPIRQVQQPESEVSIIVTTWDDEGKCWYPVEAYGPIGEHLNKFIEARRRAKQMSERRDSE
ncbi:hypothetical protein BCIN_07g05350 [Botrytis cinerea B05.10]|uniref:Uncharacterized protein n=3 Tax=Botryotinia fuckeliana TaxID=40559 RepID=A0A384JNE5_BOTFB|nr:hypothetical protein BCIN_07g05350 [Botrytis cinerea B05.10]ATZ52001.1 hypothetical protein BCIN_07g05350 [Botrytis cinerea B05.10]EMR90223.1 hypothetical protein BcDW1_1038 [Botrytis cinerea BcDW1]CCD55456.1 hypothetical protein BofuT4_P158520.1 [Botrytis cinerea T4]